MENIILSLKKLKLYTFWKDSNLQLKEYSGIQLSHNHRLSFISIKLTLITAFKT